MLAWFFYLKRPDIPATIKQRFAPIHTLLDNKYYFDRFNEVFFAGGARLLGRGLWQGGDQCLIDGVVNGSAQLTGLVAAGARRLQRGHIYQYAASMLVGVLGLMWLLLNRG